MFYLNNILYCRNINFISLLSREVCKLNVTQTKNVVSVALIIHGVKIVLIMSFCMHNSHAPISLQ